MKIADHIQYAEAVTPGSMVYKAVRIDGQSSAVQILPSPLAPGQVKLFEERMALLEDLQFHYGASVPRVLSRGFTQTGVLAYLETEWVEGQTLAQIQKEKIVLSVEEVSRIAEEVSRVAARCCTLGLIHGHIRPTTVLWDEEKQHYLITGFLEGMGTGVPVRTGNIHVSSPIGSDKNNENEVKSIGILLLQLLTGRTDLKGTESVDAELRKLLPQALAEETELPHWLGSCIDKALGNDEQPFQNAVELYSYILTHYKRPTEAKRFYRSRLQTKVANRTTQKHQREGVYTEKARRPLPSVLAKKKEQLRFVFDRNIAAGLVIAVLLLGFSLYAQNKEREAQRDKGFAPIANNAFAGDTTKPAAQRADISTAQTLTSKTGKTKKQKKSTAKKIVAPPADTGAVQLPVTDAAEDPGVYKVRSRAYFHNAPDESTKRNAFIVHWNNALLHPLKEENGFVYIVFTNDEGQTSKGWLKKSDLVKQ